MGLLRLFAASPRRLMRAFELFRHPRVPLSLKLLATAGALLILSPLDLLGDIPVLGIFDDAALLALLLAWFVHAAGPYGEELPRENVTPRGEETSSPVLVARPVRPRKLR
jgi:uncharacterized membrane protein YkvA (DUF1232 family)